ncbi:MAG: NAD-binding protein [Streptosporangiales bacterium]|nr:NAD-binding protein [Streptosporangiales bacterium]
MSDESDLSTVGFVGLGNMGAVMAARLLDAGYPVRGYDTSTAAMTALGEHAGAVCVPTAADVAEGASAVILMLPDSDVVERVLLDDGLLDRMAAGAIVVDMSSSEPARTVELARRAGEHGVRFVDAPVSGGVTGARAGTLSVMVGGDAADVRRCEPMFGVFGSNVVHVGRSGAGHAIKALNNLMSATHLLASSEALLTAREFGIDLEAALGVVNGSTGRSGSTEYKWPSFILPGNFASGFAMRLMLKDVQIGLGLCHSLGMPAQLCESTAALWQRAAGELPTDADHTEIARWLEGLRDLADEGDAESSHRISP